jgi:hypothetical protein
MAEQQPCSPGLNFQRSPIIFQIMNITQVIHFGASKSTQKVSHPEVDGLVLDVRAQDFEVVAVIELFFFTAGRF